MLAADLPISATVGRCAAGRLKAARRRAVRDAGGPPLTTRDATIPSGQPVRHGGSPQRHGGLWPSSFTLGLLFAGLMHGLLALAGAALIGSSAIREDPVVGEDPSLSCTAFQVGSPFAADTQLHLENAGRERISVRLDFVDHEGRSAQTVGYNPVLEPSASSVFVFRAPPLGAAIKLISPGGNLHASVAIVRDDGAPPELRTASGCLTRSVLRDRYLRDAG
jgi:hypothetical protein